MTIIILNFYVTFLRAYNFFPYFGNVSAMRARFSVGLDALVKEIFYATS